MILLIYQSISLKFCVTSINRIIVMQITAGLNKIIKIRESAWWGTSRRVTWRPASAKTLQINRIMEATRLLMIYARQCAGNCHRARTRGLCMCVQRLINESTGTRLRPRDDVHTFVTVRWWERWWGGSGGGGRRGRGSRRNGRAIVGGQTLPVIYAEPLLRDCRISNYNLA